MPFILRSKLFTSLVPAFITSIFMLSAMTIQAATYNSKTGELALPHLVDGSKTLLDVVIKLNADGTYAIQSATESVLPMICPGTFSEATFNLIRQANGADEINALLGCRWQQQQKTLFEFDADTKQSSHSLSWLDSACQTLSVGIEEKTGRVEFSSLSKNNAGCDIFSTLYPYDLRKRILSLQYVKIDDTAIATEVYIKFYTLNGINRYELVSYEITPNTTPPAVCKLITEAAYNAISTSMTPNEISNLLGCQWMTESVSDPDHGETYYQWKDHEWNSIDFSNGSKSFWQFRIGRTPN